MIEINGYRLLKTLGNQKKRKFNNVYLAEKNGQKLVIKQIKKNVPKYVLECFLQESKLSFSQKNLPQQLDFFQDDCNFYAVSLYKEGTPLNELLQNISSKKRKEIAKRLPSLVFPLLSEFHNMGIYHLDLKPSNLIVTNPNSIDEIHIIDFGMGIIKGHEVERKTLFALGYAAPELVLNRLNLVNETTDYYAIAAILWQILTGKFPFGHANPSMITNLQITYPFPDDTLITKTQLELLRKLGQKHKFQLPPNQYTLTDLDRFLKGAIISRDINIQEFILQWEESFLKRKLWKRMFSN